MKRILLFPILAMVASLLACSLPSLPTSTPAPATAPAATAVPGQEVTSVPSILPPTPTAPATVSGLTLDVLRNGTYYAPFYGRTVTLITSPRCARRK